MSTIKIRRNTAAGAAASNPILAEGELGYETDTGRGKMGDGTTRWNSLPYLDRHALNEATAKANAAEANAKNEATAKANAAETAAKDASVPRALIDAKGDLIVGTANDTAGRLPAPTVGQELIGDPNDARGVRWRDQPILARNLLKRNPRANSLTGWSGAFSNLSLTADGTGIRMTPSADAVSYNLAQASGLDNLTGLVSLRVSFDVRMDAPSLSVQTSQIRANGTTISNASALIFSQQKKIDQWTRVGVTLVLSNETARTSNFQIVSVPNADKTSWVEFRNVLVEQSPGTEDFFDGDSLGCVWTGDAGNSESVRHAPSPSAYLESASKPDLTINYGTRRPENVIGATLIPTDRLLFSDTPVRRAVVSVAASSEAQPRMQTHYQETSPGESWYARATLSLSKASGLKAFLRIYFRDASGTVLSYRPETARVPSPAANASINLELRGVAPANAVSASLQLCVDSRDGGVEAGDIFDARRIVFTRGSQNIQNVDYFDGDSPGCSWAGDRWDSYSIRHLPSASDWNRVDRTIYGTGSPEGVVAAPVGWEYVDEAATNGALVWRKWSGTGATGWRVEQGDTGWRWMARWDSSGNFTVGALASTDWAPRSGLFGGVAIRRRNDTVFLNISALSATVSSPSGGVIILPPGFRPAMNHRFGFEKRSDSNGVAGFGPLQALSNAVVSRGSNVVVTPGDYWLVASASYPADATAWPTSLPGTPA